MIVNLCPYWVTPPTGGGPLRVYNLNKYISKKIPIRQFSFRPTFIMREMGERILRSSIVKINKSYVEYRLSNPLILLSSFLLYKLSLPHDFLLSHLANLFRDKTLCNSLASANIVQVEHPWLFDFIRKKAKNSLLVLSSHNCEFTLFRKHTNRFIEKSFMDLEKRSIENADIVLAVSEEDIRNFHEVLGINRRKNIFVIPNGVDCSKIKKISHNDKEQAKKRLGFCDKKIILFTGSIHLPNTEAVKLIQKKIAKDVKNKDVIFLIVGSVGERLNSYDNVIFTGYVKDIDLYLKASDLAINPILSGSGTSLKMLEYMAFRLPIITTNIGARGFGVTNKEQVIIADVSDFGYWIPQLLNNEKLYLKLSNDARRFVEEKHDWRIIANKVVQIYKNFL